MAISRTGSGTVALSLADSRPDTPPLTITFWANSMEAAVFLSAEPFVTWDDGPYVGMWGQGGPESYIAGDGDWTYTQRESAYHAEQWLHWAIVHEGDEVRYYLSTADRTQLDVGLHATLTRTIPIESVYVHYELWDNTEAVKHLRVWTAALSIAEIRAERDAATAARTADLYADFPLAVHTDLSDVSGNGRVLTVTTDGDGAVVTWTAQAYRQAPVSPTPLTTFPCAFTLPTTGQGLDNETVYSYTPTEDEYLSVLAWAPSTTNVTPTLMVTTPDPFDDMDGEVSLCPPETYQQWSWTEYLFRANRMVALYADVTYYFHIWGRGSSYPLNADIEVEFTLQPKTETTIPAGSILITDDTNGWPFLFLDEDDGTVLRAHRFAQYRGSDIGSVLPNGYVCLEWGWIPATWPTWVALFDPQLTLVDDSYTNRTSMPGDSWQLSTMTHNHNDTFYIGAWDYDTNDYPTISTLTYTGTFTLNRWRLVNGAFYLLNAIAVAPDDSVLYYTNGVTGPIRRWDLVNDVLLDGGTFIAQTTGWGWSDKDMTTLSDGTLLVGHNKRSAPYDALVRRYSTAGVLLQTYGALTNASVNRLCIGNDGVSFWVWYFLRGTSRESRFIHYRVSDGAVLHDFTQPYASAGRGPVYSTETPDEIERFVHSESCALLVLREDYTIEPEPEPEPTPRSNIFRIRRLRRSQHLSTDGLLAFYSRFQLDFEAGVGLTTGQGEDPQLMLRWSDDGGHTWSNDHWVSAGKIGEYLRRAVWRRLGRSRDRVFEVTISDPVKVAWIDAWLDVGPGTH